MEYEPFSSLSDMQAELAWLSHASFTQGSEIEHRAIKDAYNAVTKALNEICNHAIAEVAL